MSQYKIGSATFTNGSADIVGVGTTWLTNLSVGDYFVRVGDNVSYEVGSVNSDASISLTSNYAGVTGSALSYVAHKDFHPNGAPKWSNADVEFAAIQNRWNAQSQPASAFGTSAFIDVGTGDAQIPTNADLPEYGTAADADIGAGDTQVPTNADLIFNPVTIYDGAGTTAYVAIPSSGVYYVEDVDDFSCTVNISVDDGVLSTTYHQVFCYGVQDIGGTRYLKQVEYRPNFGGVVLRKYNLDSDSDASTNMTILKKIGNL